MVAATSSNSVCRSASVSARSPSRATVSCCLARTRSSRSSFCRSVTSRQVPSSRTGSPSLLDDGGDRLDPAVFLVVAAAQADNARDRACRCAGFPGSPPSLRADLPDGCRSGSPRTCRRSCPAQGRGSAPDCPTTVTALDLMSHDQTPISPASSATRTNRRSGNSTPGVARRWKRSLVLIAHGAAHPPAFFSSRRASRARHSGTHAGNDLIERATSVGTRQFHRAALHM